MIITIRGKNVILDSDIARLYAVETRVLVQSVKRNIERFPTDFMFRLNAEEFKHLRSQFVISNPRGGRRYYPYAFTEQGVAMLSSVLSSRRAIHVNIAIMRAFVAFRRTLAGNRQLRDRVREHDQRLETHDKIISKIVDAINRLINLPRTNAIGFRLPRK